MVFTDQKELCVEIVTVQDLLLTAEYAHNGVRSSTDLNWNSSWSIQNKNSEIKHFIRPPKAMGLNTTPEASSRKTKNTEKQLNKERELAYCVYNGGTYIIVVGFSTFLLNQSVQVLKISRLLLFPPSQNYHQIKGIIFNTLHWGMDSQY